MQNPPKSQFFARARALQYSRLRSAGHTKCNCALRAQIKNIKPFSSAHRMPKDVEDAEDKEQNNNNQRNEEIENTNWEFNVLNSTTSKSARIKH